MTEDTLLCNGRTPSGKLAGRLTTGYKLSIVIISSDFRVYEGCPRRLDDLPTLFPHTIRRIVATEAQVILL